MSEAVKEIAAHRRGAVCVTIISLVWLPLVIAKAETAEVSKSWDFDALPVGSLPEAFQLGTMYDGRPAGEWKVIEAGKAQSSAQVLAQLMNKGAEHAYKVVLVKDTQAADLELEVSFLAVGGKGDMGGGLIWRAQDDRNYYLTRANPLEQNIRIYRVTKGVRRMIQNVDRIIDVKKWHTLRVLQRGCHIRVLYDGEQVFDICDETFQTGLIGLWTKSDAVSYFDDLRLTILSK